MGAWTLIDGRTVFLDSFALASPYLGLPPGEPGAVRRAAVGRVLAEAGPGGVVLPPPAAPALPRWVCRADLFSHLTADGRDTGADSRLRVVWFANRTARSVDRMVERALAAVDWQTRAVDAGTGGAAGRV